MNNDEMYTYLLGYAAGASGGGGGGSNTAVSVEGSQSSAFWTINWQDLVIPDTMTSLTGLFYNTTTFNPPKVVFNNNVTDVEYMYDNSKTRSVDMSGWDITNITSFYYTFGGSKLTSFTLPTTHCIADNVNAKSMFYACATATSLDLSGLYIDNLKQADYMFYNCQNATTIDIRNIKNTTQPNYQYMFNNCKKLEHLDIRGLTFTGSTITSMMNNVPTDCEIIVKDATAKTFWSNYFSSYTNVKTAAEYEAE